MGCALCKSSRVETQDSDFGFPKQNTTTALAIIPTQNEDQLMGISTIGEPEPEEVKSVSIRSLKPVENMHEDLAEKIEIGEEKIILAVDPRFPEDEIRQRRMEILAKVWKVSIKIQIKLKIQVIRHLPYDFENKYDYLNN